MSVPVNFSSLSSASTLGSSDQLLVRFNNSLSGASGFGRSTVTTLEKSLGVYSTVQSNSAQWGTDSTTDTGVRALTANWQNTYSTVNTTSASWLQTLSFNAANAQLTISNGNTVSLSALSATSSSTSTGLTIFREVSSITSPNSAVPVHALSAVSLSANVDVAIVAKGTGATLAQIPTNTAAGGNKRGQYATDFQKLRASAIQVASSNYSTIGGGQNNRSSGDSSTVAGGAANSATATYTTVGGGYTNTAAGDYAVVAGGFVNAANAAASTVAGGTGNSAGGSYATVGGGVSNAASNSKSTIPGGYGAVASVNGMLAYASAYFSYPGDGQYIQHVLYGFSQDGVSTFLSPDYIDAAINLIPDQDCITYLTVQIIGIDEDNNFSSGGANLVVKCSSNIQTIESEQTIGSDVTTAGTFDYVIDGSSGYFVITGTSNSGKNTRWLANIHGIKVIKPSAYTPPP